MVWVSGGSRATRDPDHGAEVQVSCSSPRGPSFTSPPGACLTHCRPPGSSPGPMGMGVNRGPAAVDALASCRSLSAPQRLWDQLRPPDPRNK